MEVYIGRLAQDLIGLFLLVMFWVTLRPDLLGAVQRYGPETASISVLVLQVGVLAAGVVTIMVMAGEFRATR